MHLTIRQLEALVAAADAASFSEAAARLGISQPSLSETIKRIEAELGVRLFERTTRSLKLTADGVHAAAVAREALRDFHLALETIVDRTQGRRGRLVIAAIPSIACALLPPAVRAFRERFPGIEIRVHDFLHERTINLVRDGLADLALSLLPAQRAGLSCRELGSDPMRLVCPADHPLAAHPQVRWSELPAHPFVALARTSSVRQLTDAAFVNCGVACEPAYEVEQIPSAAALVRAGLGLTALPALTLAMFKPDGLGIRPLIRPSVHRSLGIVMRAERAASKPALAFSECVEDSFRGAAALLDIDVHARLALN